jgi:hypothetical protein
MVSQQPLPDFEIRFGFRRSGSAAQRGTWAGRRYAFAWLVMGVAALLARHGSAVAAGDTVDLGASLSHVHTRLGTAQQAWATRRCPDHLLEIRRTQGRWLKLVFGPDGRLLAAGIFRLSPIGSEEALTPLQWPGLVPRDDSRRSYPDPAQWVPWQFTQGAKQWFWIEQETTLRQTPLPTRERYLGGVAINGASEFARGRDFPGAIAAMVTANPDAAGLNGWLPTAVGQLIEWRRRTAPNAYIEAIAGSDLKSDCHPASLALLDFTDAVR